MSKPHIGQGWLNQAMPVCPLTFATAKHPFNDILSSKQGVIFLHKTGESFIGSLLIGFSTTLPEITVSFTAMRLGAVDMAIANMIGSNLFNMAIIPIDDLLYSPGPVLASVSTSHLLTAGMVILMTGIFIAGLHFRPRRFFRMSWCSLTLIALFLIQAYFSYTLA